MLLTLSHACYIGNMAVRVVGIDFLLIIALFSGETRDRPVGGGARPLLIAHGFHDLNHPAF